VLLTGCERWKGFVNNGARDKTERSKGNGYKELKKKGRGRKKK